jgi:hypothetical protein
MKRLLHLAAGTALVAVFFAWLVSRHSDVLQAWTSSSTLTGWALHGAAWLALLGGVALLARAWVPHTTSGESGD